MILTTLILALSPAALPQEPSAKDLFDHTLAGLRMTQAEDGSYGSGVLDTANVILGLTLGPRAYRSEDGPFVRDAVAFMGSGEIPTNPNEAFRAALALQVLDAKLYKGVIASICDSFSEFNPEQITALATGQTPKSWPVCFPEIKDSAVAILMQLQQGLGYSQTVDLLAQAGVAYAAEKYAKAATATNSKDLLLASFHRGADFLLAARGESGLWEVFGQPEPGMTALAARALMASPRESDQAAAQKAIEWLRTLQQEDGSIHNGRLPNYVTAAAIGAISEAGDPTDAELLKRAAGFLRSLQLDGGEGYSEGDKFYGGIGYGGDLRPDLSNLQYALQALNEAGVHADDPAFQRAILFLERTQNRSESNTGEYHDQGNPKPFRSGNDGGAAYYPGNSPAGTTEMPDGTLIARSYGSMTYALLKCYTLAGLTKDDPRVKSAIGWIQRHWTLEVNPGFDSLRDPRAGFQGLYYYYLTLAEALKAAGIDKVVTPSGAEHNWQAELVAHLAAHQKEDGSWVNADAPRWWEGNPVLCTAYALNTYRAIR